MELTRTVIGGQQIFSVCDLNICPTFHRPWTKFIVWSLQNNLTLCPICERNCFAGFTIFIFWYMTLFCNIPAKQLWLFFRVLTILHLAILGIVVWGMQLISQNSGHLHPLIVIPNHITCMDVLLLTWVLRNPLTFTYLNNVVSRFCIEETCFFWLNLSPLRVLNNW